MGKVHVYRAGNSKQGTTEERKKAIIKTLLDKDDYSKAIMYDDARPNLHTFIELKQDHPRTKFYAWHVNPEGKASEYMRESTVSEKRKRKSRWAAYGPGPFGGYGFAAGYSGDGGIGEGKKDSDELAKYENDVKTLLANGDVKTAKKVAGLSPDAAHRNRLRNIIRRYDNKQDVSEASYPGNVGMMEVAEFFKMANEAQKKLFKELLEKGKRGLAWKLIQDVVGVKLQGKEFDENFADGKKPGRKGLAKRSGVPTKASVSRLRKIAKSSSGEKARMAHWLANMKSGKAKKK
jgi:hypothetical protein